MNLSDIPTGTNGTIYVTDANATTPSKTYVHYVWDDGRRQRDAWTREGAVLEMAEPVPSLKDAKEFSHVYRKEGRKQYFRALRCLEQGIEKILVWSNGDDKIHTSKPLRKESVTKK